MLRFASVLGSTSHRHACSGDPIKLTCSGSRQFEMDSPEFSSPLAPPWQLHLKATWTNGVTGTMTCQALQSTSSNHELVFMSHIRWDLACPSSWEVGDLIRRLRTGNAEMSATRINKSKCTIYPALARSAIFYQRVYFLVHIPSNQQNTN